MRRCHDWSRADSVFHWMLQLSCQHGMSPSNYTVCLTMTEPSVGSVRKDSTESRMKRAVPNNASALWNVD